MPGNPNKLSQFWQELKRRKVIHVIVVYASSTFVIIELVNNVYETLRLPEWTPALTLIILSIGFPLAIIFSWIYDITSKGITKTAKAAPGGDNFKYANSVAVLPFQDMSPQKDQEYFCDGIAEEIINALCHVSSLKVIARTSAFAFKYQNLDVREISQRLNVESILEGSIRKDGNRLRITAQLIRAEDGLHIWSERFDRELEDIFAIQDEISLAVVDNLKIRLLGDEKTEILKRYSDDFEVYDLYLKAMSNIQLATYEGYEKAAVYLRQVLEIDPLFVPGYHGLAEMFILGSYFGNVPPNEAYPKAKEYAEKALEIDNKFSDAHRILGLVSMQYDWDWEAAESHFKIALKLNPNGEWIHHSFSQFLAYKRKFDASIVEAERAVELDPVSGYFNAFLGLSYLGARKFKKAITHLKHTIATFPDLYLGHLFLGLVYQSASRMGKAIKEFRKAMQLANEVPITVGMLASSLFETGDNEEAERFINDLKTRSAIEYVPSVIFAIYYFRKGLIEYAEKYLEQAIQERDGWLLSGMNTLIKEHRIPNEPKYVELMKQVGLEQYFQNE